MHFCLQCEQLLPIVFVYTSPKSQVHVTFCSTVVILFNPQDQGQVLANTLSTLVIEFLAVIAYMGLR